MLSPDHLCVIPRSDSWTLYCPSRRVTILPVDRHLFARGWQLYKDRPDKEWGLTDCIGFIAMAEEEIREAFVYDRHFQQAGYTCLLGPA